MQRPRLVLAILALVAFSAVPLAAQFWRGGASLGVEVKDGRGRALAGARVEITFRGLDGQGGPPAVLTDQRGRAAFVELAAGSWNLEASHPDHLSYVAALALRPDKKAEITASFLQATGAGRQSMRVKFFRATGPLGTPAPVATADEPVTAPPPPEEAAEPPARAESPPPEPPVPAQPRPAAEPAPRPPSEPASPEVAETPPQPPAPAAPPVAEPETAPAPEPRPAPAGEPPAEPETVPEPTPVPPAPSRPTASAPPAPGPPTQEPEPTPEPAPSTAPPRPAAPPVADDVAESPQPPASAPPSVPAAPADEPTTRPAPPPPAAPPAAAQERPDTPAELPEPPSVPSPQPPVPEPPRPTPAPQPEPVPPEEPEIPPLPVAAPPSPSVAPEPAPRPEPEIAAEPPPPPPPVAPEAPPLRSFRDRTCPECKPGEWAATAEAVLPRGGGGCGPDGAPDLRPALRLLASDGAPELDRFAGQAIGRVRPTALDRASTEGRQKIESLLASQRSRETGCRALAVALPAGARFVGFRFEAVDDSGGGDCMAGADCPIGDSAWLANPAIVRGEDLTVVVAVFENRSAERTRKARLIAYFDPPAGWRPSP